MIFRVATALGGDLLKRTAFVGGVTTGLFVTDDFAREGVRFTDDVDLIVDIVSHGKWVQLQEELRSRGFREPPEDDVICRMRLGDLKVDFMPDDEGILGFSNRWYSLGFESAVDHTLTDDITIRRMSTALPLTDVSCGHDPSCALAVLTTALGPSIAAMLDAPDTRRPSISCSMDSSRSRRTSMASADPFWISACG